MEDQALGFEEIRPYVDAEVPQVMAEVTQRQTFALLMGYLYPDTPPSTIAEQMSAVKSVEEFQHTYISHAVLKIVKESISELSHSGFEDLDPNQSYLFISNHRDIILDSALLNLIRYELGHPTTLIAIGDNLLITPLITDLMKLNKSFIVHRNPPRTQAYAYSLRLAKFIQQRITQDGESVWLAQRNGRTKDGVDRTQPSLLKMLQLAFEDKTLAEGFRDLRIVPMAISYELEPCDYLKAEELVCRESGKGYDKNDREAIIKGIRDPKGRVHLAAGQPLDREIMAIPDSQTRNDWLKALANEIDKAIFSLYHRWPIQYVAHDLLHDSSAYQAKYTDGDIAQFQQHLDRQLGKSEFSAEAMREMILRIYSGMIPNAQ